MSSSSVTKSITVEASREVAFKVFTERMGTWWPSAHHIGKSALLSIIVEPRAGGRWAERGVDGTECDWGRVLSWEPPHRLLLAWQLTADFEYDADFSTEVEVRFIEEAPKRTRVELEHRQLERFGARQEEMRAAFDSDGGWTLGLNAFAKDVATSQKKNFLLRLLPPRPTFAQDMSETERKAMNEHVGYWTRHVALGTAIAFGPVADPKGGWGVAIVAVDDDATVRKLTEEDPAIRAAIGLSYEILWMPLVVMHR